LIEANAFGTDWRAVFLVNVPIGIVAYFATGRVVPDVEKDRTRQDSTSQAR
jgi:predicted MFS family arabinose efflux permease